MYALSARTPRSPPAPAPAGARKKRFFKAKKASNPCWASASSYQKRSNCCLRCRVRRIQSPLLWACPRVCGGPFVRRVRRCLGTRFVELFFVFISSAFAQTAPAAAGGGDMMSQLTGMLPLVLMFVVLYFVMIRPQMKRQKEHKAMIDAIAKGDEVATAGGILGTVTRLSEGALHIQIAPGVEVQIQRNAVAQVLPKGSIK